MNARATFLASRAHTLDELLFWVPSLMRRESLTEWERGFLGSMLAASRRRGWQPSAKQEHTLRELVERLFQPARTTEADDGDEVLIEDDA